MATSEEPRCPLCGQRVDTPRCPYDGVPIGDTHDALVGAVLAGRYKILTRLGRGGMASVYLARHVLIDRLCAIKILRRDLCDDPVQRDRFLREARAVNRIHHPNVVEITDYGESEDGRAFLVMEFLAGESLQQVLARGTLSPVRALDIGIQIASGLARAHQMGVIHRDLKPDNVFLVQGPDGREQVKILDFGIAKILDQPSITASDNIFGTPGYIAPEYAARGEIDGRADLYSLGVVLYQMVTGQLPFDVQYPNELLLKHVREPPIPPRQRRPELPEDVERVILRALAKDPNERYRDAHHMLEDLVQVRASLKDRYETSAEQPDRSSPAVDREPAVHLSGPLPIVQPPEKELGPGNAQAWTRYLDALRDQIARCSSDQPAADTLRQTVARMEELTAALHDATDRIEQLKKRTLALEAKGRDFRATIGRAMDALAAELSVRVRERDALAQERDRLEKLREELAARARDGDRTCAAEADAVLWQIAACDELLRQAVTACEDVEYQLSELGRQLERLNEALEADQSEVAGEIHTTLQALADYDAQLRALADKLQIQGRPKEHRG